MWFATDADEMSEVRSAPFAVAQRRTADSHAFDATIAVLALRTPSSSWAFCGLPVVTEGAAALPLP